MDRKKTVMLGAVVGSTAGGFIPDLWGASAFSMWGIVLGGVGGLLGIWLAYRMTA